MEDFGKKPTEIPISRVKTIMRSSPDVENVAQEAVYVVSKAAELFIRFMAQEAYNTSGKAKTVEYKHVSEIVSTQERFGFLQEIVPKKCTLREIAEYQKEKGLKVRRPGTQSSSSSEFSFSSGDESESGSEQVSVSGKDAERFDRDKACRPRSPGGLKGKSKNMLLPSKNKDKLNISPEVITLDDDDDDAAPADENPPTPMSIPDCESSSLGSGTPSPSPSYSSLSPVAPTGEAASSHSSDCEVLD